MVTKFQKRMFDGDKVKEFKVALAAFLVLFFLVLATIGASFLFRSEGFQKACEEVQDNNSKLVNYLEEAEQRSIARIEIEVEEGKEPINSIGEIKQSFHPVIHTFQPIDC